VPVSEKQKQPPRAESSRVLYTPPARPPSHRFASAFFTRGRSLAPQPAFTSPVTFKSKQKNYFFSLFRLHLKLVGSKLWNWIQRRSALWVFEERVIGTIFRPSLRRSNQLVLKAIFCPESGTLFTLKKWRLERHHALVRKSVERVESLF